MSAQNDTRSGTFRRIGRKKRQHLTISAELDGVLDQLQPNYVERAGWFERLAWQKLVDEHGVDAVMQAIEDVQDEMDDDRRLPENRREDYELPA